MNHRFSAREMPRGEMYTAGHDVCRSEIVCSSRDCVQKAFPAGHILICPLMARNLDTLLELAEFLSNGSRYPGEKHV